MYIEGLKKQALENRDFMDVEFLQELQENLTIEQAAKEIKEQRKWEKLKLLEEN